jgi:ubiquinone/menaquinone biosynthesis C-methylase UbiE
MTEAGEMEATDYLSFYRTAQGRAIAEAEAALLDGLLRHGSETLSIGCGPAIVEQKLLERRPDLAITGLDASMAMLRHAPQTMPVVQGQAEALPFPDASFDAIMYITSLEFIAGYTKALDEARRVLRPYGRLVALMLNPATAYFRERYHRADSYVQRHIEHPEHDKLMAAVAGRFTMLQDGYRLGVDADGTYESIDPEEAVLHMLEAIKHG